MARSRSGMRVLIADDEEEILELLGEYLRALGYHVHTASDGQDALEIIRSGEVDLVLTDMKMPSLGGVEVLAEVKNLPHPVATIIMTGFGTVETALAAMKDGACDYILKPFKLKDVHHAIQKAATIIEERQSADRMKSVLAFYELGLGLDDVERLPRLYGMLANVAMLEAQAEEVAVWLDGPNGWEAVARGGHIGTLAALAPSTIHDPVCEAGVIAEPIYADRKRVGVLAVAGGQTSERDALRIRTFARVAGLALARVAPGGSR